jgi:hypothetical protein
MLNKNVEQKCRVKTLENVGKRWKTLENVGKRWKTLEKRISKI